jgi:anti-sigma factor RsiW
MKCEKTAHLLDTYFDRELDASQSLRLEQHLSDCLGCRSLMQEGLDFRAFFRSNAPVCTAPSELRANVLATVRHETKPKHDPNASVDPLRGIAGSEHS